MLDNGDEARDGVAYTGAGTAATRTLTTSFISEKLKRNCGEQLHPNNRHKGKVVIQKVR